MEESTNIRSVPELERFILKNVKRPGEKPKKLGTGSYGSVEELEDGGVTCAGKTLHDSLIDVRNEGVENITKKFIKECQLMGDLRHPHIVQFLGICFLPDSQLPVLVMEYLTSNLDHLLQKSVSLSIKTSILYDVARGLAYLHGHSPPVIHRDLTATNVLLNSAMVAKIADFGNARIVDISPNQLAQTMTRAPGTTAYLPPEALEPHPQYNSKIDIFSFGHLALYTVIQEFPMPTASTYTDPKDKMIVARSEIERRQRFIDKMEQMLILSPLKQLIVECLCNDPDQRPSTERVVPQLVELQSQVTDPYWHMGKLEMIGAMEEKQQKYDSEAKHLQSQIMELEVLLKLASFQGTILTWERGCVKSVGGKHLHSCSFQGHSYCQYLMASSMQNYRICILQAIKYWWWAGNGLGMRLQTCSN